MCNRTQRLYLNHGKYWSKVTVASMKENQTQWKLFRNLYIFNFFILGKGEKIRRKKKKELKLERE